MERQPGQRGRCRTAFILPLHLPASLRRSLEVLDNEELRLASSPAAWLSVVVLSAAALRLSSGRGAGAALDSVGFRLACTLLICLALAAHVWIVRRRDGAHFSQHQGIALLIGTAGTQFFAATLFLTLRASAGQIFGMLFLFCCLINGSQTRAGLRRPWMAVGTVFGVMFAAAWSPGPVPWGELAILLVAGIALELIGGEMAYRRQKALEENARLRAVVHAQLLWQQEQDGVRLNDAIAEAVQNGRVLREIVTEAVAVGDLLQGLSPQLGPRAGSLILRMQGLMGRLDALVYERLGKQAPAYSKREAVALSPLLGLVIESIRFRFPYLVIEVRGSLPDDVEALVLGGPVGCRRILESILLNACEGDGTRAAQRVVVSASISPYTGQVTLEFRDDGPGFPPQVLAAPVEGLLTTKEGRQNGLGLYSASSMLTASGGGLERENAGPSGARVLIRLPVQSQGNRKATSEPVGGRAEGSRSASA